MLKSRDTQMSLNDTELFCSRLIPEDSFYRKFRDIVSPLIKDETFSDMYTLDNGRPAIPPSLLAMATILQFYRNLSDREMERAVIFGGRYDYRVNFLRSSYFSMINRFLLSADTTFWKKTRTHFYTRLSTLEYNKDGSDPSYSSRDGFRGGVGVTQYFYSPDFKSFFFVKPEFNFNQTRGDNFIRRGVLGRIGAHTPIKFLRKTDFDISVGYDWGEYPEFYSLSSLDTESRLDKRLDNYVAVTYHFKPNLAWRTFYRFIKSDNNNGFFDRERHIAGMEMIFSLW